ncbi:MAG: ribonuclease H-like domain-containing protein [Anaerovoracaceae bacterium]
MYTVNKSYNETLYQSKIFDFYFGSSSMGVFDIETTGLSPKYSQFILGGLLTTHPEGVQVQQYFAESIVEEADTLATYLKDMNDLDVLFSYNGDNFDLPFLKARTKHHGLNQNKEGNHRFPLQLSFDLYKVTNHFSDFRKFLPNLKQKTLEAFMGFWSQRADVISGAESVYLYYDYLNSKDPSTRESILLHNLDDILQLSRLLKIFDKLDLHKIMFYMGFFVHGYKKKALVRKIQIKKDAVIISGHHQGNSMDYRNFGPDWEAIFQVHTGDFQIRIPCKTIKDYRVIDIESFSVDCSPLEKYAGYESGYLIIKDGPQVNYGEINHLSKLIIGSILNHY